MTETSQALPASTEELATEIQALTRVNRVTRDVETERRLLQLRYRAGSLFRADPGVTPASAAPQEAPPSSEAALPEVSREALSAEGLRTAILRHGCLIVRGLVDGEVAAHLAAQIDRAFQQRSLPPTDREPGYYEEFCADASFRDPARRWIQKTGGLLLADSPMLAFELIDTWESTGIARLAADYLDDSVALALEKTTLRRVGPKTEGNWHQDGSFMGSVPALNVWLSLSDCGIDAPGLDIVGRRLPDLVPPGGDGAVFPNQVSQSSAERAAGASGIVRPVFAPGDAVLFDELCLHRTASEPSMTGTRHAIESWFFAAGTFPPAYSALALTEVGAGRPA